MTAVASGRKISLPKIESIEFENFDLYSREAKISVDVLKPVFCLIGANGLGKSTFLNTLNYVVTGALPDPSRTFKSATDYFEHASRLDKIEDYFGGRISEEARNLARATVVLGWPNVRIAITRDLFEDVGIARLAFSEKQGKKFAAWESIDGTPGALQKRFQRKVVELCNLRDFPQFVFLVHFVATFDEGRHLLMWDYGALTNALYLAFGTDPAEAADADKLQREMERESSRGRNVRFSARHVAERIKQLNELMEGKQSKDDTTGEELRAHYEQLLSSLKDTEARVQRKQTEMREADLKWTDLSASLTEAQLQYRQLFSTRLSKSSSVKHHPIVRASVTEDRCAICGTAHTAAIINTRSSSGNCPLCESPVVPEENDPKILNELRRIDVEIGRIRRDLSAVLKTRERVGAEFAAAQSSEEAAHSAVKEFEEQHNDIALSDRHSNGGFSGVEKEIEKLEAERQEFLRQSAAHYKKRDAVRDKLRKLEKKLKGQYEEGAERFVPRFRELAEEFIGLPIDVGLEHRQGANDSGFGLSLIMNDQLRSEPSSVSESQRFFIDIALRMALSEFMAVNGATLLIDTPEGSLDIAYEARAGAMFSRFVSEGNAILMTANLRSSELVLRLAELEKYKGMQIVRMTDWTDLSEVQQSEERLFVGAYREIEKALASK